MSKSKQTLFILWIIGLITVAFSSQIAKRIFPPPIVFEIPVVKLKTVEKVVEVNKIFEEMKLYKEGDSFRLEPLKTENWNVRQVDCGGHGCLELTRRDKK